MPDVRRGHPTDHAKFVVSMDPSIAAWGEWIRAMKRGLDAAKGDVAPPLPKIPAFPSWLKWNPAMQSLSHRVITKWGYAPGREGPQ